MRNHTFQIGEYYHIYNRGTDKRDIILDKYDLSRFFGSLQEFNSEEPIRSIYLKNFNKNKAEKFSSPTTKNAQKLVSIISYCINPNHFHLLLSPLVDKGIEKFMQRIGGYTRFFNEKYDRSGVLFQGKFKSKIIGDDNYLLQLAVYINMNNRNEKGKPFSDLSLSSLEEYTEDGVVGICDKDIILSHFNNKKDFLKFAKSIWKETLKRKDEIEFN